MGNGVKILAALTAIGLVGAVAYQFSTSATALKQAVENPPTSGSASPGAAPAPAQQERSVLFRLLERQGAAPPAAAPAQQERGAPPIRITAAQLHREYDANEVAADAKYKGRQLLVDGSIASVDKDFADGIVLRLRSGDEFNSVNASLDSADTAQAANLRKGQRVTLLCRGGTRIIGSATLDACRLR
jgi:hypothetical protein